MKEEKKEAKSPTAEGDLHSNDSLAPKLHLEYLRIRLLGFGPNKGKYVAKVKYEGESGCIEINLSPEITNELMRFCGGAIKRHSETAMLEIKEAIDQSVKVAKAKEVSG